MSDAARLARQAFEAKPAGVTYAKFSLPPLILAGIQSRVREAALDSAYACVVSLAEALAGLAAGSSSWGVVRLYYSSFYSIKSSLLLRNVVPFNSGGEMVLDIASGRFLKGGRSSHHWNWGSLRLTAAKSDWLISQDSEDAYGQLRGFRENVNYTHGFTDPIYHPSLMSEEHDLGKRMRAYRDDTNFTYTYLSDHLAFAYPVKLIFYLDSQIKSLGWSLSTEQVDHIRKLWKLKDRCPLT